MFANPKTVRTILTVAGIGGVIWGADKLGLLKRFK
jgi:hypothetical protein